MSSATLPHIWQQMARSALVKEGDLVVSLAFGPGLTLSGAVLRKVAGH
jgi:predicted naringenin-chalcone synthase